MVPSAPLYSNRAFCHIKMEALGSAILDADEAVKCDKLYAKAYYRKGTALAMQSKHKPARKEFLKVCKLAPKDKNAVKRCKELDKIIKELAFAAVPIFSI